jgi:hypothetical protein
MGTELQFIDGADLRKQDVYDEIPKAFGERVVVFPNGGRPDAVSFVYCEPYESLRDAVRKHFEGVASIREVTTDSQPKESRYGNQSNRQLLREFAAYGNNLTYDPFPVSFNQTYNSNGFVSGLLIGAGATPPNLPGIWPGYGNPIPVH